MAGVVSARGAGSSER